MQIMVVGNTSNLEELKQKFGQKHLFHFVQAGSTIADLLSAVDVVFDFAPEKKFNKARYLNYTVPVFLNTSLITLSELTDHADLSQRDSFFGFCGLPTFVNRSVLEVCMGEKNNELLLNEICLQLETDFVCVEDRVGLVTPRVICMIINEAYCTLEEGTATRDDIDLAMKRGTNYPYGPFEWATRIGLRHVIALLDAVYHNTHDDRYTVCTLLRKESGD